MMNSTTIRSINDLKIDDADQEDESKVDQQTEIGDLPIEMLYKILEHCEVPTLLTCSMVSLILKVKI